jgi:anti-sigma B factor antagonist
MAMAMEEQVNCQDLQSNGSRPHSSGLEMAVMGDVPDGRVVVAGELDMLTAPRLGMLLMELLHRGYRQVNVDAAGLDFCGAAGLNALCEATRCYRMVGGRLRVVALASCVRRVLILAEVDDQLDIDRGGEEASSWQAIQSIGSFFRPTRHPS